MRTLSHRCSAVLLVGFWLLLPAVAMAQPEAFTLTVHVRGTGTVTRSPDRELYALDEEVVLTAIPGRWYAFSHWNDYEASNPRVVITRTNTTFTAVFTNTVPLERTFYKVVEWESSFGGRGEDMIKFLWPTDDGGVVLAGEVDARSALDETSEGYGNPDYWILKLDAAGSRLWEHHFGGEGRDLLSFLMPAADGGFFLGGFSDSAASGNKTEPRYGECDLWVLKLDSAGNKLWERALGGTNVNEFPVGHPTRDGGLLVGGYSRSGASGSKTAPGYGGFDYWVVKLKANGQTEWERSFGGEADDFLSALKPTADGGYVLAGSSYSEPSGNKTSPHYGFFDFWVVKIDNAGNQLWEKTLGGAGDDVLTVLEPTPDDGLLVGGFSDSDSGGDKTVPAFGGYDYWVVQMDAAGTPVWQQTFGGDAADILTSLTATRDGGWILGGYSRSPTGDGKSSEGFGQDDVWLVKVRSDGTVKWEQTLGGTGDDVPLAVREVTDGGILIGGYSNSGADGNKTTAGWGSADFWVVKADAQGRVDWEQCLGGASADILYATAETASGDILLTGMSHSNPVGVKGSPAYGHNDGWVIKLTTLEVPVGTPLALVNGNYVSSGSLTVPTLAKVDLRSSLPDDLIFYTLDGSPPDANSLAYTRTLTLTQSVVLRAIAFNPSVEYSAEADPITLFILPEYALNATTAGGGSIALEPPNGRYLSNTVVEVTAMPEAGWSFIGWRGDTLDSRPTLYLAVDSEKRVEAVFGTTVEVIPNGPGTVSLYPKATLYPFGSLIQLIATPAAGFYLDRWTSSGSVVAPTSPLEGVVTNALSRIQADFEPLGTGQGLLYLTVEGEGRVFVSPDQNIYTNGQAVLVTAVPAPGMVFTEWSGAVSSGVNPLALTIEDSQSLVAYFLPERFILQTTSSATEGFRFSFVGHVGQRYRVESSRDLTDWSELVTITNTGPVMEFRDATPRDLRRRFFRVQRAE